MLLTYQTTWRWSWLHRKLSIHWMLPMHHWLLHHLLLLLLELSRLLLPIKLSCRILLLLIWLMKLPLIRLHHLWLRLLLHHIFLNLLKTTSLSALMLSKLFINNYRCLNCSTGIKSRRMVDEIQADLRIEISKEDEVSSFY